MGSALLCEALAAVLAVSCAACAPLAEAPRPMDSSGDAHPLSKSATVTGASDLAIASARRLGRGINFGNMLDAPREGDWGLRAEEAYIDMVARAGFIDSVRLPVRWSNHASADADAIIDPRFFDRVDSVIDGLLSRGLTVVLDMHHYRQLEGRPLDRGEAPVAPDVVEARFYAMWRQIAVRYARHGDRLLFEPYNEPNGDMDARWNVQLAQVVSVIRRSNPRRVLVVGPGRWNDADRLRQLVLPPDPHLILTVHQYEPFEFTHQGAEWIRPRMPTGIECCDASQRKRIVDKLEAARRVASHLGYPIYVGEFGAISKAPQAARLRFLRFMRDEMAARNMPWAYWELASTFGIYDPVAKTLREDMVDALYRP